MHAFGTSLGVVSGSVVLEGRGEGRVKGWVCQVLGLDWLGIRRGLLLVSIGVVGVCVFGVFDKVGDVVEVVVAEGVEYSFTDFIVLFEGVEFGMFCFFSAFYDG